MKHANYLSLIILLLIPFQSAYANTPLQDMIVLNAKQVDSADDIEAAILSATAEGKRPGTVILDGRKGVFAFTGDDRSLNIFVSNLVLRGRNQAVIENCDDGLFFDDFALEYILIEEIAFFCTGDGLEASGTFEDVTIRNNMFQSGNNGISTDGASSRWLITGNLIQAGWDGIQMRGAREVTISNNHLAANIGIALRGCSQSQVQHNTIYAEERGVLLGEESWKNRVQSNMILGVSEAGITLEPGVIGNSILSNWGICAFGATCLTIEALPVVVGMNTVAGNRP